MKAPSTGMLAFGLIAMTGTVLIGIGAPHDRNHPAPVAPSAVPPPSSVTAHGFTLQSTSFDLPPDDAPFPDGPHADLVNTTCTSCHSASMAITQPALSAEQWRTTVTKMREVYKAPVAEGDIAPIVTYLTTMPGQMGQGSTGKAQDPDPKATP